MSWQTYIDKTLLESGHLDQAAIVSLDGSSTWATSSGFTISPEEGKAIAAVLTTKEAKDSAFAEGFHVSGQRYVATKAEDRSLYGRQGRTGIAIAKTAQTIIIGHYGEQHTAGNAANVVEKLADYLIGQGF
jgi:profilin